MKGILINRKKIYQDRDVKYSSTANYEMIITQKLKRMFIKMQLIVCSKFIFPYFCHPYFKNICQ